MKTIFKPVFGWFLMVIKPLVGWLVFRSEDKLKLLETRYKDFEFSGMVTEFGKIHDWLYVPFFRRVECIETDIEKLKQLQGSTVFIIKNKGQLEYRYFNYLFLKEKMSPIHFALGSLTLFWWPVARIFEILHLKLAQFYRRDKSVANSVPAKSSDTVAEHLSFGHNVLLSLTISRDYLFGLIRSNPLKVLEPLIEFQRKSPTPVNIVTLQFLFDKHPDKSESSYFDLLFGEKSQPGAIRKMILFFINYTRSPRVKFGDPIQLQSFFNEHQNLSDKEVGLKLLHRLEESLAIEKARVTGPMLKSRDEVLDEIMTDTGFISELEKATVKSHRKLSDVRQEAMRYLREIAADVNYSYVQFFHVTLSYVWNNIYDGVVIKREQLNRVREIAGESPVVLVPMHRSHMDYLLISDIFYGNNITFPYVCGGINLNFWPIGRFIRKAGGFFIRRTFDGNAVYRESLYRYMRSLLASGHCLEFFIEGGRSRTGKMLKPKMGILSLLLRAYAEGIGKKDVYFVPIAVSYEQIIEQKAYQQEKVGSEKTKENAGELLKVRKIFNKKYGKVYIEFAEPISLKSYLENHQQDLSQESLMRQTVNEFGYHLTYHMNKAALVTPVALLSLAILSLNDKTFTTSQINRRIETLKDYLKFKGAAFSDLINFSSEYAYNEAIRTLIQRGMLKEVETFEENFYMLEDRHRADLDYYKNGIVHFFVSLTCVCKIINSIGNQTEMTVDAVVRQFELIKTLLKHDFTFSERNTVREHILKVIHHLVEREIVQFDESTEMVRKTLSEDNAEEFRTYFGLLDNFFESHLIALRYFKHNHFESSDRKTLIREILLKGKPMYLKSDLKHPEALSQFNLENSFNVFVDLGIITEERVDKKSLYTSSGEAELVSKWIASIQDYLVLRGVVSGQSGGGGRDLSGDAETVDWH